MTEHPEKVFPCDCQSEGLVVVQQEELLDDCEGAPFIDIAFWQFGHINEKWEWKYRIKVIWHVIRTGKPFVDMVMFRSNVARNFANHILYLLDKHKKKKSSQEPLVKDE